MSVYTSCLLGRPDNVDLMLVHHLRHWPHIKSKLGLNLALLGYVIQLGLYWDSQYISPANSQYISPANTGGAHFGCRVLCMQCSHRVSGQIYTTLDNNLSYSGVKRLSGSRHPFLKVAELMLISSQFYVFGHVYSRGVFLDLTMWFIMLWTPFLLGTFILAT